MCRISYLQLICKRKVTKVNIDYYLRIVNGLGNNEVEEDTQTYIIN